MVQKQKSVPQKTATSRKFSTKKIFLLILLALVLIGCLVYAWRVYQSHRRFAYAEQKKNEIIQELVKELGDNVAGTRVQNECFEAEQRPYYGGKLWCQTATIVKLNKNVDFKLAGNSFMIASNRAGLTTGHSGGDRPNYWAYIPEMRGCELSYRDASGETLGAATSLPFIPGDTTAIAVACADRAATKHYPYVAH